MTTSQVERTLLAEKNRWAAVATHWADLVCTDSQANHQFRQAQEKQAAITRTLQRVATGTFGRCDRCGGPIEPGRLEVLLDSDCHICAVCAKAAERPRKSQPTPRRLHTAHRRSVRILKMA